MCNKGVKHSYRLTESSWGLAVDIYGRLSLKDPHYDDSEHIASGVYLALMPEYDIDDAPNRIDSLNQQEIEWLRRGVLIASDVIAENSECENTVLAISKISFNPCDFQAEALACAVVGLVGELLNVNMPRIDVNYDSNANRYLFTFPS